VETKKFCSPGAGAHLHNSPFFGVHLARQKHLSALLGDDMLALLGDEMVALLGDKMFAFLGDEMRALLGDEMLALLGEKMFALIGDKKFAHLGDEMLALLGDEMLAPDRKSARSNRDVACPIHNNDRRESPSKSKSVVSLNRENKGCPALQNKIKTTKECKRCPGTAQWLTCSHIADGSNGSLARISRRLNGSRVRISTTAQWLTCSHIDDGSNGSLARISRRLNCIPWQGITPVIP
jgi:hypothetical protein